MDNFRKFQSLAVAAAVFVSAGFAAVDASSARAAAAQPVAITAVDSLEADVLLEINALRARHGLRPLRLSAALRTAADSHSAAMARRGFFAHESADGGEFWKRVQRSYKSKGFRYWAVGENLLWSSPDVDAKAALQMWLDSPPHRKVLLTARWREIGLSAVHVSTAPGVYGGADVTILTANFGVRY